jgi:uncharacterized protein (DUF58 family)
MADTTPKAEGERLDASLYLHPRTLARLGSFELRAKMIVEGVMSGQHRSPHKGVSIEFAQHRQYVPGDDIRHLDWKVYGRTDKLHLKEYQQETNLDLIVMVDASGSMDFGSRTFEDASGAGARYSPDGRVYWSKFDHATAIAAALAFITLSQGDRVGLVVFASEVRRMVGRSSQRGNWRQIVEALATHPVDQQTDFPRVVDQVLGKVSNRCLIALVSDLFADPDDINAAMARIKHRGHDLIVFQVLDGAERNFSFEDLSRFEGLEGEGRLAIDPRALRKGYLEALNAHNARIQKTARAFGFDYEQVYTDQWLGPALAAFVAHRNAQIKKRKYG